MNQTYLWPDPILEQENDMARTTRTQKSVKKTYNATGDLRLVRSTDSSRLVRPTGKKRGAPTGSSDTTRTNGPQSKSSKT